MKKETKRVLVELQRLHLLSQGVMSIIIGVLCLFFGVNLLDKQIAAKEAFQPTVGTVVEPTGPLQYSDSSRERITISYVDDKTLEHRFSVELDLMVWAFLNASRLPLLYEKANPRNVHVFGLADSIVGPIAEGSFGICLMLIGVLFLKKRRAEKEKSDAEPVGKLPR